MAGGIYSGPESMELPAAGSAELQAKACILSVAIPARAAAALNRRTAVGLMSVAITVDCRFSCMSEAPWVNSTVQT